MSKKIMLIDGNSIAYRGYYALPDLKNSDGKHTGAIYGFLNIMFKFIDEEKPDYLAVAFDLSYPTFRHQKYENYKGTRKETPNELIEQISDIKEILNHMGIKIYQQKGFEADDILGTLSKNAEDKGIIPIVVSGDRDLLQIASDTLKVKIPKTKGKKTEVEEYYASDVIEKYGVTPKQLIDLKALMGDASDNIKGVYGIGEKTALKIIKEYKNIENAIENAENIKPKKASENLLKFKQDAIMSKFLVTIVRDMDIEFDIKNMRLENMFNNNVLEIFKNLEFKSFYSKFEFKDLEYENIYNVLYSESEILNYTNKFVENKIYSYYIYIENNIIEALSIYDGEHCVIIYGEYFILKYFKKFFECNFYKKIGSNIKNDIKILDNKNIKLCNVIFDIALGAYILNPTNENYYYNDIANEYMDVLYPSYEKIFGKGKSKVSIKDIDNNIRNIFMFRNVKTFFDCFDIIKNNIEKNNQHMLYYEIEFPLIFVLLDMEKEGIKIDIDALNEYDNMLSNKIDIVKKEIFDITKEEFNINSPKQLGVMLFEKMEIKGGKKTKTGYSTSADILEKLKNDNPIIEKILYYRHLSKLKSTYVDGLLNVIDKNTNKIYSTFNQTVTATGRISSTEPNLQNIPIRLEIGRQLRKIFIPSDENRCFVDADYSQIELRVLAHISEDETLINAFKNNQDIHRLTASQVFNVDFDDVTDAQRRNAKAVNFGIVYGIGAFSLSEDLEISRSEAEFYINSYFNKYPKIKLYMDNIVKYAQEKGYVSTLFGRIRKIPELKTSNFKIRSFGERVAMNTPIQGTAADIIKIAMIRVYNSLKEKNLKSKLILQVHDELLIDAYNDEVDEVKSILKYEMENAMNLNTSLDVDMNVGKSWFDTK